MKIQSGICFLFIAILSGSCQKEKLPQPSQNGANTFGCKINGKNWVPNGGKPGSRIKPIFGGYVDTSISPTPNSVFISAYRNDNTKIDLHIQGVTKPGVYELRYHTGIKYAELNPSNYGAYFSGSGALVTNPQYRGRVTITRADTTNFIVSGTFEFNVYDPDKKKTIRITDGRFDINSRH